MTYLIFHHRHVFVTDRGVMCLDIHPVHSHLIVVGFYDGKG